MVEPQHEVRESDQIQVLTRFIKTGQHHLDPHANWRKEIEFFINKLCEIHELPTEWNIKFWRKLSALKQKGIISDDIESVSDFIYKIGNVVVAHDSPTK